MRTAKDIKFPPLRYWNYDACRWHDEPKVDCEYEACGGDLFTHQRVGITWLYLNKRGILADVPGAGKTNHILGLCALLKERSELTGRAIVVCQPGAVLQWRNEAARWTPRLNVEVGLGDRSQRVQRYAGNWDVLVIGYQMLLRDLEVVCRIQPDVIVSDDVDPLRNEVTATHRAINRVGRNASRAVVINATPLQIRLQEMYNSSVLVGGTEIFGSLRAFERRYVRQEATSVFNMHTGKRMKKFTTVGYKNGTEYREKIAPIYLRRNYDDLTDIRMPDIAPPETVWLEMHPAQRKKYTELQEGVIELLRGNTREIKHATALTKVTYGQQICAGLPALKEADGPEASIKLDWLMEKLTHDWYDQKIIVFIKNVGMIAALEKRCAKEKIGVAKFWGQGREAKMEVRAEEQKRFWDDPNCKVAIGNTAMERSLNLQVSNIVVNVDTLLNPARMHQILGRSRRAGSRHERVFTFTLLCTDSQEAGYKRVLRERQGIVDFTWGEETDLFGKLSPLELLTLIKP